MAHSTIDFSIAGLDIAPMRNSVDGPAGSATVGSRAMDVMVVLAQNPGRVVSREELHDLVWGERVVVEDALNRCISELRQAFRRVGCENDLIGTVRGRGYRLRAEPLWSVEPLPAGVSDTAPAGDEPAARRNLLYPVVFFLALGLALWQWGGPSSGGIGLLGVEAGTPLVQLGEFTNQTGNPALDSLANSLAQEFSARLALSDTIRLRSMTPAVERAAAMSTLSDLVLTPEFLITGTLEQVADALRLTLAVAGPGGQEMGFGSVNLSRNPDRSAVMTQAYAFAATAMQLDLDPPSSCIWSADHQAMELYFSARSRIQARERHNIEQGIALLKRALDRDSGFGQARATLAAAYDMLPYWMGTPLESRAATARYRPLAVATASEALAGCASLGEAWMTLGTTEEYQGANDWIGRGYALRRAVALEPNNDDILLHHADMLERVGFIGEALEYYRRGYEINPHNARLAHRYASALAAQAPEQMQRALAIDAANRGLQGYQNIRVRLQAAMIDGEWSTAKALVLSTENTQPEVQREAILRVIDALENPARLPAAKRALEAVSSSETRHAVNQVLHYGGWLQLNDLVFERLESNGPGEEVWPTLFWQPELRSLREDERFTDVAERMGLLEYWQVFGDPDRCNTTPGLRCHS